MKRTLTILAAAVSVAAVTGAANAAPVPSGATVTMLTPGVHRVIPKPPVVAPQVVGGQWVVTGTFDAKNIAATVADALKHPNGSIPDADLCSVLSVQLRCDAAKQLTVMNTAFTAKFGSPLTLAQGYRSLAGQYSIKAQWSAAGSAGMAATPGTSNHGMGLAMDTSGPAGAPSSAQHAWLVAHGPTFGWVWPCFMRPGGTGPSEAWHFEFQAKGLSDPGSGCTPTSH